MMRTVFQSDEFGCGIACLAMLANISYDEAKTAIGNHYVPDYGVDTSHMLAALEKYGFRQKTKGRLSQSAPVNKLNNNALLHGKLLPAYRQINPKTNSYSHWAVWDVDAQVVRDPYRYKKPFWLTSYIELEPIT